MGFFSFINNKPVKPELATSGSNPKEENKKLFLLVSPMGWRCRYEDENGKSVEKQWIEHTEELNAHKRLEVSAKDAATTLADILEKSAEIYLLLDGADVYFSDSKPQQLVKPSGVTARKFGQEMLHTEKVTFGYAKFPKKDGTIQERQHYLYAFADADFIRPFLAIFNKNGVKVKELIPKNYLMIQRAFNSPTEPYGSIHFGAYETNVVLVNPYLGTLVIRRIPIGVLTFASAIDGDFGIGLDAVLDDLSKNNWVKYIAPPSENHSETANASEADDKLRLSQQTRIIKPYALTMLKEITTTLNFFAFQRVAGYPERLEVYGESKGVNGLLEWLETNGPLNLDSKNSLLEHFATCHHPISCNLLNGAAESLLTVNRIKYHFTESHGFIPNDEFIKLAEAADKEKNSSMEFSRSKGSRKSRHYRKKQSENSGLFASLNIFSAPGKPGNKADYSQEERMQDRPFIAIFALLFFGILFLAWDKSSALRADYDNSANIFIKEREKNIALNNATAKSNKNRQAPLNTTHLTKILWTEKFLILAKLMDNNMWFTDLYLGKEQRNVGRGKIESTKLIIEGNVLPSTVGHIEKIASYLEKIKSDKGEFMTDFQDVTFEGAELEGYDEDSVVHFTLEAWHDQQKRKNSATGN